MRSNNNHRTVDGQGEFLMWILLVLLCFVFPLGAVIIAFLYLLSENNRSSLCLFAIITAAYISFVNISKSIMSDPDLPWYTEQYKLAGKMDFFKYIFWFGLNGRGRELFFPTYNYLVHFIAGDNLNLYRFILSLTCYLLSFYGIIRMGEYMKISYWRISVPIIWFACFPWIFTYSQTLLRQFLAGSLLIYIVVERFLYNKKVVVSSICMVLTHTSAFIFIPFLYISFFRKPLKTKTGFLFCLSFIALYFVQSIARILYSYLGSADNALSYAISRASVNTTFELPPLGMVKIAFLLLSSFLCLFSYYNSSFRKRVFAQFIEGHVAIINTCAIFCVFIISNIKQLELSNRLFNYAAMLSVFPMFYALNMVKPAKFAGMLFLVGMNLVLILYFTHSMYTYDIPYGLLVNPLQLLQ